MSNSTKINNKINNFDKTITVSGDKSLSIRWVIFSSMAQGKSKAFNLLLSEDVMAAINAIKKFGIKVKLNKEYCAISGNGPNGYNYKKNILINAKNSGTLGRLIMGLLVHSKGKIKIKKIEDNTSSDVEILVHLPNGVSPDKTIDGLFAFTNCEVSISPLSCIIENNKPVFIGVSEILKKSTENTKNLLKDELEVKLKELDLLWHYSTLEKIFIENRIYRRIEEQDTWEGVLNSIKDGLKPYLNLLINQHLLEYYLLTLVLDDH